MKRRRSTSTGVKLDQDILDRVSVEFGASAGKACELLQAIDGHLPERARSLRCIVFLAEGDTRLLPLLIDQAISDYRDVIFWAEYRDWESERPRRLRNFNQPFGKTASVPSGAGENQRLPPDVRRYFERKMTR